MAVKKGSETTEQIRNRILDEVSNHPDLDGVDIRVFLHLFTRLNFEEFTHIPQIQISMALNRQKTHVSRSIKLLTELGLIVASDKGIRASEWRLNEKFGGKH
jgi:predicted transcriptional regulator